MIETVQTDIFQSQASTLVNPVNTKGVMGAGLALEFKKRFPGMFVEYQQACRNGSLAIGKLVLHHTSPKKIISFPTKGDWRQGSKLEYIEKGLLDLVNNYKIWKLNSIAFPKLGCGLGGLSWFDVQNLIVKYLQSTELYVVLHV